MTVMAQVTKPLSSPSPPPDPIQVRRTVKLYAMNGRTILSIPKDILGEVDFKAGEAVMVVANSVKQEIVVRRADE